MRGMVKLMICALLATLGCNKKTTVPAPDPPDPHDTITKPPDNPPPPPPPAETTAKYFIAPGQTDPQINIALDSHFVSVKHHATLKNVLFLFLPGSYRFPADYTGVVNKAVSMGYHGLGLMYPNLKPTNTLCAPTNDTTCHRRARMEIVDGVERHPDIDVNPANSIINRLVKALQFLDLKNPDEHWGQFVKNGEPDWTKIIVSGHSQGAGNAALIGKYYPVRKVVMFSITDYLSNKKMADWENFPANKEKYYSLFNPGDELLYYNLALVSWQHLGMTAYGPIVNVDSMAPPYGNTHTLITRYTPSLNKNDKYHNSTAVDTYIPKDNGTYLLDAAWEYLLGDVNPTSGP